MAVRVVLSAVHTVQLPLSIPEFSFVEVAMWRAAGVAGDGMLGRWKQSWSQPLRRVGASSR